MSIKDWLVETAKKAPTFMWDIYFWFEDNPGHAMLMVTALLVMLVFSAATPAQVQPAPWPKIMLETDDQLVVGVPCPSKGTALRWNLSKADPQQYAAQGKALAWLLGTYPQSKAELQYRVQTFLQSMREAGAGEEATAYVLHCWLNGDKQA